MGEGLREPERPLERTPVPAVTMARKPGNGLAAERFQAMGLSNPMTPLRVPDWAGRDRGEPRSFPVPPQPGAFPVRMSSSCARAKRLRAVAAVAG